MNENYLWSAMVKLLAAKIELDRAAAYQESGATLLSREVGVIVGKLEEFTKFVNEKKQAEAENQTEASRCCK